MWYESKIQGYKEMGIHNPYMPILQEEEHNIEEEEMIPKEFFYKHIGKTIGMVIIIILSAEFILYLIK